MKNYLLFISILFLFSSCRDNDDPLPDNGEDNSVDMTLDRQNPADESSMYKTFYKPANGETGDPMPFYNEADQTFYVFYLLEIQSSSYSRGGVYLTKTKDFANFGQIAQPAILVGDQGTRDEAIGTGSCIKKDNTYHFFYTGFSGAFGGYSQVAVKATSSDLATWTKKLSPVTAQAPADCWKGEFRDPCVYWDDTRNKYVMAVAGIHTSRKATIVRYQSDDLNNWEAIEPILATTSNHPQAFEIQTDSEITECPDIFKMGDKWYMVFSRINRDVHRKTFYRIADNPNGPWRKCDDHETFDGLYLYAAKTVSDGTNRYISGWASSGQQFNGSNELDWGGMLVTHKLMQQPNGKLYPVIPSAVDAKFSKPVKFKEIKTEGTVSGNDNHFTVSNGKVVFNRNIASVKIEMTIDASAATKSFGIAFGAYENQQDTYDIKFDLTANNQYGLPALFMYHGNKEHNFTPLIVPQNKIFNVKIVLEKSLCVLYINDNVAFTNHISNMNQNPWLIFADEGTVKFENIKIYKQ
jgi:beta-fructofuranosidase